MTSPDNWGDLYQSLATTVASNISGSTIGVNAMGSTTGPLPPANGSSYNEAKPFTVDQYNEIKPFTVANSSSVKPSFTSVFTALNNSVLFALSASPMRATALHFSIANS